MGTTSTSSTPSSAAARHASHQNIAEEEFWRKPPVIQKLKLDYTADLSITEVVRMQKRRIEEYSRIAGEKTLLRLLDDASEEEHTWFSNWQANYAETVIHTDESLYADWELRGFTEFDVFEKEGGNDAGYNAWLNRLCGLPDGHDTNYFLAFNLEDRIDPRKILDRQRHHTPRYTAQAVASVNEIKAANGRNNTYYAGAYLYNGLHEGAIQSALAIKSLFA